MAMRQTIEGLKVRMDKLHKKDPVANGKIVAKLRRKIRKMEDMGI